MHYNEILIKLLLLLIVVLLIKVLFNFLNHTKLTKTIIHYPPADMDPIEVKYYLDNYINEHDFIGLLIYWDNQGYIKISEETNQYGKTEYIINKLKDLNTDKTHQKYIFNSLFRNTSQFNLNKNQKLIKQDIKLLKKLLKKSSKEYGHIKPITYLIKGLCLSLLAFIIIQSHVNFAPVWLNNSSKTVFITIYIILSIVTYFYLIAIIYQNGMELCSHKASKSNKITAMIAIIILIFISSIWMYVLTDNYWFYVLIATLTTIITILISTLYLRNKAYKDIDSKLQGFKAFIYDNKNNQMQIKQLIQDNPNYFNQVIPYVYVLGASKQWFNNINQDMENHLSSVIKKLIISAKEEY